MNKLEEFLELIIEYLSNGNAAGEYDGDDPRLQFLPDDLLLKMAKEIQIENDTHINT